MLLDATTSDKFDKCKGICYNEDNQDNESNDCDEDLDIFKKISKHRYPALSIYKYRINLRMGDQ